MREKRTKQMETEVKVGQEAATTVEPPRLSFNSWFTNALKQNDRLKQSHYDSIKVFFKRQNLSEYETKDSYDAMLRVFGF